MNQNQEARPQGVAKRIGAAVGGGVLILVGVALLILPGPGMLLVLAGVLVLAHGFPAARRYVEPVRERALEAARQSVTTPLRITLSVLAGIVLIVAGVVWGLVPWVPFSGWATGSSLILSGVVLHVLLVYSYLRTQRPQRAGTARS